MFRALRHFTESICFDIIVAVSIIAIAINIGLVLSIPEYKELGTTIDTIGCWWFTLELVIRILAKGKKWYRFFCSGWNLFDFCIIVLSMLPIFGNSIIAIRLLRIMKLGRLFAATPQMRILITAMMRSFIPSLGVCMLLLIVIYVYAIIGTELFSGNDPQRFGDLGTALVTMFSFITVDDWYNAYLTAYHGSDVFCSYETAVELVKSSAPQAFGWKAGLFFISYMIFVTFIVMNLFVGVIISCLQTAQEQLKQGYENKKKAHRKASH